MPVISIFFGIILNRWTAYPEQTKMIKILQIHPMGEFQLLLEFSDGGQGHFDGRPLLRRTGPLLEALRDPAYFARAFVDAGALCWPNGLELSPSRVRDQCRFEPIAA